MTTEEEWIYLDEDVPEIHIREIISIDELLTTYPQFVALSDEEIYNKLLVIFQNHSVSAHTYYELHKELTHPEDVFERYYKHVLYHVHALRKQVDSEEYEKTYLEALDAIYQNKNYITRQIMKAELHEPFEAGDVIDTENKIPIPKDKLLQIQLTTSEIQPDNTIRLSSDKENYDILGAEFIKDTHTPSMYVMEHIKAHVKSDIIHTKEVNMEALHLGLETQNNQRDLFKLFTQTIIPSITEIVEQIDVKNISDMRSLQVLFQIYGRDIEEIDIDTYEKLVAILQQVVHTDKPEVETGEKERVKKTKQIHKTLSKNIEISDVKIHLLFWKSVLGRLLLAKDAPMYSETIQQAIYLLLDKPFKTDIYQNVAIQLKKMAEGSVKLEEFIQDIRLWRQLEERNLLHEFSDQIQTLQPKQSYNILRQGPEPEPQPEPQPEPERQNILQDLEKRIETIETLLKTTIDPAEAEKIFSTKPFLQRQVEIEEIKAGTGTTIEYMDEEQNIIEEPVDAYVVNLPEDDDEIETEEPKNILLEILNNYESSSIIQLFKSIEPVLTRLQELTKMPWDLNIFIRILIQRAPPLVNISAAMSEIDTSIREDILYKIAETSFEEAMNEFVLPMEKQQAIQKTYYKALKRMKEQKIQIFFMFIAYWILHIQSLMIEGLFVLHDIADISCKSELQRIGFPIDEGREGKRGVLHYFICVLQEEGHDIPNIKELIDDFSKDELDKRIRDCFNYFTHEINTLKNQHHSDVIYQGNNVIKEADEIYQTLKDFQKRKFKSREMIKPYIRNLQLLPSLLRDAKQQRKHALGCCYARLDSQFQAERNLTKAGIIASREYFARKRIGKLARPLLLHYTKAKKLKEPKELKEPIPYSVYEITETKKKTEKEEIHVEGSEEAEAADETWRDKIKRSPFLPASIKQIVNINNRNEESQIQNEALRYIDALFKSANIKMNKEIWETIRSLSKNECISTIIQIYTAFHEYIRGLRTNKRENSTQSIYEEEIEWILSELTYAHQIMKLIQEIEIPEEDYKEFRSLLIFILCRITCLPGDVEPSQTIISTHRNIHANFIKDLAKNIAKKLEKHLDVRKMPTKDDIEKKINEIREQNKNKKYERYDENAELAKLETEMNRSGYKEVVKASNAAQTIFDRYIEDLQADREGIKDFAIRSENPDNINEDSFDDY